MNHPAYTICVLYDNDLNKIDHVVEWDDRAKTGIIGKYDTHGRWLYNESFLNSEAIILCHDKDLADLFELPYGGERPKSGKIENIEI